MGQQQSKDELLFQQVSYGNSDGIKELHRNGAGLEFIDREGKTPLIVACMNPELLNVAKTLIELGANLNFYRPGRHAGTPLHHAAKRGLENVVKLLLSSGANPLATNDDCQTPLNIARLKRCSSVVRVIESHICLFSGWMREFYGPGFLEALAPQLLSRKVWVVVLPCVPSKPFKLELAIYTSLQDALPRTVIALWKAKMDEPNFDQFDPSVTVYDSSKVRIKLASSKESDKQQLQWFCNACKGIMEGTYPEFLQNIHTQSVPATAPPTSEGLEIAMAINESIQFQTCVDDAGPSQSHTDHTHVQNYHPTPIGSAPPFENEDVVVDEGPIHYPSVDYAPVNLVAPVFEKKINYEKNKEKNEKEDDSTICVICLDAPIEGACAPCGHMAGCMSCLNEIKAKKWGCPVCRTKIDQVIKLYAV